MIFFPLQEDLRNVLNVKNSRMVEGDNQHTFTLFKAALAAGLFKLTVIHSCLEDKSKCN